MDEQTFRILSLDGGGTMGAFSASALATFEHVTGQRIVDHFDLITGPRQEASSRSAWPWVPAHSTFSRRRTIGSTSTAPTCRLPMRRRRPRLRRVISRPTRSKAEARSSMAVSGDRQSDGIHKRGPASLFPAGRLS